MSELDTSLRGLRDELHAAIPVPDVSGVAGRARSRRRTQLGAIIAVILVALAVPVLRSFSSSVQPAEPPPEQSFVVDFADADHGYALATHCPKNRQGCSFTMYVTTDGGRNWQPRKLPAPPNPKTSYFAATMYVLDPDQIAIDRPGGSPMRPMSRVYSPDAGRSWQVIDRWAIERFEPVATGGLLTGACFAQPLAAVGCEGLATIQPGSGKTVPIPTQPRLYLQCVGSEATADGRLWTVGRDRSTGAWSVAVSDDDGRTWTTSELAVVGVPAADGWSLVERNGVMYVTANDSRSLLGVWRSTDDGQSWTRTWSMSEKTSLPAIVGSPIAAGDGSLILSDAKLTYVSTDQGRTFRWTGDNPGGTVTWTRAGYLRANGDEYALSKDGLTWRTFTIH
jgi:photosystem II stability/assembly factor-like uncharacterized protein